MDMRRSGIRIRSARARWAIAVTVLALLAGAARGDFQVTGSDADKATWNAMLTECSNASTTFKNLVDKIKASTTKTVTIKLVRNEAAVTVDRFATNAVDLSDIEDFAKLDPPGVVDRCQAIIHVLAERWYAAEHPGTAFGPAHEAGINAENAYRAGFGYTDRIQYQKTPSKPGHTQSADKKKICHQWVENGNKSLTYDPIPGERSETAATSNGGVTAPGTFAITTNPGHPNQDVIEIPQFLGGGTYVLTGYSSQVVVNASVRIPAGMFHYSLVELLSIEGDAPPVPLSIPPFTTGPNHFSLDQSAEQLGIWNVDNGQIWVSYGGKITNNLFPASHPLRTYSVMTGTIPLGSQDVVVNTSAAFLDGEGDPTWSHYPLNDCNGNGVQDYLDLTQDTSLDDGTLCGLGADNEVLDACDCADCNGNGIPDVLDIQNGTSQDCRGNGIPDECDINSGDAEDVNGDGIPDQCEGACCLDHGICSIHTGADCVAQGGAFRGDGTDCAQEACDCLVFPYCFGDGSGTPCPCGNTGGTGQGCANSTGAGALLTASGTTSVSAGDLVLHGSQLIPNQPGLYFQGTNPVNGGSGVQFGDGLRCAGGTVVRLQVAAADGTGNSSTSVNIATAGGVAPGDIRRYQLWYRNPSGSPCGSGFNLTNGLSAAFCR